jgi:CHAT domain-containing protein/tetratricopeptide (TPR) repeat protein
MPLFDLFGRGKKKEEETVTPLVLELILAESEAEAEHIARQHHIELTSEAAGRVLDRLLQESQHDRQLVQQIRQRRALLTRARESAKAAPKPAQRAQRGPSKPARQARRAHIPTEALTRLARAASDAERERIVDAHPQILAALQSLLEMQSQPGHVDALADKIGEFHQLQEASAQRAYLEAHPELLTDVAALLQEYILADLEEDLADDPEIRQCLLHCRDLLTRCREQGIEAGFAPESAEDELEAALDRLNALIRSQPDNLEARAALTRDIIPLVDRKTQPRVWGHLRADLASMLLRPVLASPITARTIPGRAEDIEEAIALFSESLATLTRQVEPDTWGQIQNDLGAAYLHRVHGNHAENLEQAIQHIEATLQVVTRQDAPQAWARTHYNLGRMYYERVRGDRADNLEQALQHYQQALQVETREHDPEGWASNHNNLGLVLWERIRGDRAQNIEEAIHHYDWALQVRTRRDFPREWAALQSNLGLAYSDRLLGDRAENIERAIACHQRALTVRTREEWPEEWARTMGSLGTAYMERELGDPDQNMEQAIQCFQQSLQVRTRKALPDQWAMTQYNLGLAYSDRGLGDPAENTEQAIAYYQRALEVWTRRDAPEDWANAHNSLGSAYKNRLRGDREANIEKGIEHYQRALQVYLHEAFPEQWAMVQHNLGHAHMERIRGRREDNLRRADQHFRSALQVYTLETFPLQHRNTHFKLGEMWSDAGDWQQAYPHLAAALEASEALYQTAATAEARRLDLLAEGITMTPRAAYCLIQLGRYHQAVELLEQRRARALADVLGRSEASLGAVPAAERDHFVNARRRVATLEAEARRLGQPGSRDFVAVSADLRQARQQLQEAVARVRQQAPQFMADRLDFADIAALAGALRRPLVYLFPAEWASVALIVPPGAGAMGHEHVVALPDFKAADLQRIFHTQDEDEAGYLDLIAGESNPQELMELLDGLWPMLKTSLMAPIVQRLHMLGCQQATLIASDVFRLLPLTAIALDEVEWTQAPSARVLQTALRAAADRRGRHPLWLGIGNPLPNPAPLPFARLEVERIAALFPAASRRAFLEREATRSAVTRALPGATHLHFSCHGAYGSDEALDSALFLSGDDTLTLRDLLDGGLDLSASRLAVLSACQTGITDFLSAPDEAIGFPAGFLQAGVPAVISTLWPVVDISTALLLIRFYRLHLQDGLAPSAALRQAQMWLRGASAAQLGLAGHYQRLHEASQRSDPETFRAMRYYQANPDVRPFHHPYYWAAFVFSGVGS